jgi:hypothetical protein
MLELGSEGQIHKKWREEKNIAKSGITWTAEETGCSMMHSRNLK